MRLVTLFTIMHCHQTNLESARSSKLTSFGVVRILMIRLSGGTGT